MPRPHTPIEPGTTFGRLTVLQMAWYNGPVGRTRYYYCRCVCGTEKMVLPKLLRSGKTQSCGCLQREHLSVLSSARVRPANRAREYTRAVIHGDILNSRHLYASRKRFGISQIALAHMFGISQCALSRYENGHTQFVGLQVLRDITTYFKERECLYA